MGCFSSSLEKQIKEKALAALNPKPAEAHPQPVVVHDASAQPVVVKAEGEKKEKKEEKGEKGEKGEKEEKAKDPKKEALKMAGGLYKKYKKGGKKEKSGGGGE